MTQEDFDKFCENFDMFDFDDYYRSVAEEDYDECYDDSRIEVYMSSDYDTYDLDSPDEVTYGKIRDITSKDIIKDLVRREIVDLNGKSLLDEYDEPKLEGINYFTVYLSTPWERYEIEFEDWFF